MKLRTIAFSALLVAFVGVSSPVAAQSRREARAPAVGGRVARPGRAAVRTRDLVRAHRDVMAGTTAVIEGGNHLALVTHGLGEAQANTVSALRQAPNDRGAIRSVMRAEATAARIRTGAIGRLDAARRFRAAATARLGRLQSLASASVRARYEQAVRRR